MEQPDAAAADETSTTPHSRSARSAGGGGGGPGGSGGSGGGGNSVGFSTGGWDAGSIFTDNIIITTNTRQWYAPIYDGHKYKKHKAGDNGGTDSDWSGISTPWGVFNFNCYASHFSPQDWQRLTNEYVKWRPKSMTVKIYNLQIKQIVKLGADTLYNNDLTAGVHVFCDGSHRYPYSQHPWDKDTMPELPDEIWKLPQYAYYQIQDDLAEKASGDNVINPDDMSKNLIRDAPLYILETSTHEVLRTGEDTSFNFTFSSGWVMNDRAFCPPQADFNPLSQTRRYSAHRDNNKNIFGRYNPYKKPSNWFPGPALSYTGNLKKNNGYQTGKTTAPITVTYQHPHEASRNSTATATGVSMPNEEGARKSGYNVTPVNHAYAAAENITLGYDSAPQSEAIENITTVDVDRDMTRWGSLWACDGVEGTYAQIKHSWMFPMQAWNGIPIARYTPIWVKIPRTDFHTLLDSPDGTLPMTHPPGNIFCKVAKIPVPSTDTESFLNIYVTGQVTCEIVWEAERYQTKNWRPEIRNDVKSFKDAHLYDFDTAGKYNTPENFNEEMPTRMGINRVL
ncbi:VP2 protein [Bat bocavirus]|nr:VP2 protein [Bat bocavirus]AMD43875.1 VP2 protein [Bat bocavirus]